MAHDVLLEGALFPSVPAVMLPDGNGTFHRFTDVGDTTATAADVTQGKRFYNADGTQTTGAAESPTAMTAAQILAAVQEGWV